MYYQAPDNSLHVIDPKFAHMLPAGSVAITDKAAEIIRQNLIKPTPVYIAPISPRQIRMALTRAGIRDAVELAVAAGDQDLKDWWEYSTIFERENEQVSAMGDALSQTSEQLDALWALGLSL